MTTATPIIPTVAAYQSWDSLDEKQREYIEKRRAAAREAKLAVVLVRDAETGKKIALVASESDPATWYRVRRIGDRYLCSCPAMMSPETGEYDRLVTCKHAQSIYLIHQGETLGTVMHLESVAAALPSPIGPA